MAHITSENEFEPIGYLGPLPGKSDAGPALVYFSPLLSMDKEFTRAQARRRFTAWANQNWPGCPVHIIERMGRPTSRHHVKRFDVGLWAFFIEFPRGITWQGAKD